MSIIEIILIIVYLMIIAGFGYMGFKRTKSASDYMVAGRKIHPLVMAISYGATFISTSAIVGFGGIAAQMGMGILWLTFLNIFVGIFIAFVFFGKRTRKMGHNLESHTFPELLGIRYGSKFIQIFSGLVIFLFMPIYASAVLKGGVEFIATKFSMNFDIALLIFAIIIALYVSMGGLKGVMYNDAFQGIVMFIGMVFLLVFIYNKLGGVTSAHQQLTDAFAGGAGKEQTAKLVAVGFNGWTAMPKFDSVLWWALVSSIVMGVGIGVLAQPQLVVRFMTVKSDRELNRAVLSGGIFILMMTGVAFVVGALTNVLFINDAGKIAIAVNGVDGVIPTFITDYLPGWFGIIFLLTLLSAAMSTLSSQFHAMGTSIGRDVYETASGKKKNSMVVTKLGILVVILISVIITWLSKRWDASLGIIARATAIFFGLCAAAFLPMYIGALYSKKVTKVAAIWSMISGFVVAFIWNFFINGKNASTVGLCGAIFGEDKPHLLAGTSLAGLANIDAIIFALPVSIIVILVVSWLSKPDVKDEIVNKAFAGIK
jgi:SSS family solute:Na+ symporter